MALLTVFLFASSAVAQVRGTIVGPGVKRYPVAVSELKNLSPASGNHTVGRQFAELVSRDLELSGHFNVLPRESYIEKPETSGITTTSIEFGSWSVIGALAVVKGSFRVEADRLRVEARLFDVYQRRLLVGRNYHGGLNSMRRMAHRFADEILKTVTGERGPFDSRIAFVSTRAGRFKEVFVMSLDGGDVRQVTQNNTINLSPSWVPDGSLLFTSYKSGNPDLYKLDVVSGAHHRIAHFRGLNLGGVASPDGRLIAMSSEERGNPDIVLLDSSGKLQKRVTTSWAIDVSPSWSPDGKSLAFCSDRTGGPQIYVAGLDGGRPRRVTYDGNYNTSPVWSPRGDRIAYVSRVGGRFQVFTVGTDGGRPLQISKGGGDNEDPSWSPDGRYLVYSSTRTGSRKLFLADAGGAAEAQLTTGNGNDSSPAWSRWLE